MQIVFNTKVKLSQPYFNCNLGNHSVASFCSEECHACLVVSLSSALYGCMYNSIFLDAFICLHVSRSVTWTMTVCCSCSTSACQYVTNSLQCTILLVVTCTFHLVSLYKVIYRTSLIAQAHSTLHILPVIRLHLVVPSWNNLPDSRKVCSSISCFKPRSLYHLRHMDHISYTHKVFIESQ